MTSNNKHNEYVLQGKNPKVLVVYTSAGKVTKLNPQYDPRKCAICGERKGIFGHTCK